MEKEVCSMNKVSVIIPTYKRANMLERAIESVLKQTYKNIEILVIDDNNADSKYRQETSLIMEKYRNTPLVKYVKHEKNRNGAAARNTGILHSTGDLITFLDDDDWYAETKVEQQVNFLLKHKEYDAVYCGSYREMEIYSPSVNGDLSFEILSGKVTIRTNTIMMWKEVIQDIGGWNEEFIRNQEAALLLKFFKKGYKIGSIKEPLVYYDLSDRNNALDPIRNKEQFEFHLQYHDDIINELEKSHKNAKTIIYCRRYRGILFALLKRFRFKDALIHYLEVTKKYPFYFNLEIIGYIFSRLKVVLR